MVVYCALMRWASVVNESIDLRGRHFYHINVGPLREVGNTLPNIVLSLEYKFT